MRSAVGFWGIFFFAGSLGLAQQSPPAQPPSGQPANPPPASAPQPAAQSQVPQNQAPPRSDSSADQKTEQEKSRERSAEAGESSSRDTQIDTTPPKDDVKNHPNSGADQDALDDTGDVQEMHPWNPYRALKDDEVGDYYFKQKDYKGALARYQDALIYKPNDAVANFRMAQVYEKMGQPQDAIPHYQEYLKILPQGPFSKDAKKALAKLGAPEKPVAEKVSQK